MACPNRKVRMNRAIKPARDRVDVERQSREPWQPLALIMGAALVIGLAILLQLAPTHAAEGYPDSSALSAGVAIGSPLASPRDSIAATELSTYTVWLPYIAKAFRPPTGLFGVQIYGADPASIDGMSEIGTAWARLPISWYSIEPQNTTPENYSWPASFEEELASLTAHHIQVILLIGNNPSWAATYRNGPIDLVDIGELTQFVQAVVARYGQPPYNVKYWEMYNEPENGNQLLAEPPINAGYFGHTPEAYVDILEAVYQPIKAVDPAAKVLLGGLAYDLWEPEGPFVQDFLDQVLINGGAAYFDLMNFHYYLAFRANWEPYGHDILGKLAFLRAKMDYYDVDKPVVCTETGWFTNPDAGGSDEVQSRYVVQSFVRSMTADLYPVIWFTLLDSDWDPRNWGLLDMYLNPKPSYYAYQTLTNQLSRANFVRALGPEATGPILVEAYEFASPTGQAIIVAWVNDEVNVNLTQMASEISVVDKFGSETIIYDGDDGQMDGRVHVSVGPSPVYLRIDSDGQE
jgi:Cellulase (glycosyl hydrolase family 5)